MSQCESEITVGSYPGEQIFWCQLEAGHQGDHQADVYWDEKEPDNG